MRDTIADVEPLDNPAWHALTSHHARFAEGDGRARRYEHDVAPFAALPDEPDTEAWDALANLVGPAGTALIFRTVEAKAPADLEVLIRVSAVQMVASERIGETDDALVDLGAEDVPEMLALVARTEPGPFFERTQELGSYIGLRDHEGLVAMAGERMRGPGFSEISAVCTDHRARRQGLATHLVRAVAAVIEGRGDTPILHVVADNTAAIRVYDALGFETRAVFDVLVLRAPARAAPERFGQNHARHRGERTP
jgi:ribosomal protein S18 acetylase RimI-like enzyme